MSTLKVQQAGLNRNIAEAKRALDIVARLLSNKGLKVIFRGTDCCTDGKTFICLPELSLLARTNMTVEEVKEAQVFLDALRGFLFHEVAHVLFTDQDVWAAAATDPFFTQVLNVVEDPRVEQEMAKKWKGAVTSILHTSEWMLAKTMASFAKKEPPLVAEFLTAFLYITRLGFDHPFVAKLSPKAQALLAMFRPELLRARKLKSTADAVELAKSIVSKLRNPATPPPPPQPEEGDDDDSGVTTRDDGESDAGEPPTETESSEGDGSGEEEEEDDDDTEGGQGHDDDEKEDAEDDDEGGEAQAAAKQAAEELSNNQAEIQRQLDSQSSEEQIKQVAREAANQQKGDDRYLIFTTEFDEFLTARSAPPADYHHMMKDARAVFGVVKRNLANVLRARADTMSLHELEEGDLDTAALYRLASGMSNKVFMETVEQLDTSVAVALLVNESGSMDVPAGAGMTRMGLARVTCALLGEVLDSLNIPFTVIGHTTGSNALQAQAKAKPEDFKIYARWGPTRITTYKHFTEKFSFVKARLPTMRHSNNTHDGEALIYAGNSLLNFPGVNRRILITIDDGGPMPCTGNIQLHIKYLHDAVAALTASKVEILGMGMATSSVKHYYPAHVVVNDLTTFPVVALKEMKRLLSGKKS